MRTATAALAALACFLARPALADGSSCVPPPGGKCLDAQQFGEVKKALEELDKIHKSPAVLTAQDPVVIIQDWQGRVYVNGGQAKPLKFKLKLGDTVDRDMQVTLPTEVYYRPKPPDPLFRLRIKFQAGLLVPQMIQTIGGVKEQFWDAGLDLDFFHLGVFNVSAYAGVFSCGGGLGIDLTRNFGPYVGYSLIYDGLRSTMMVGAYFSFN